MYVVTSGLALAVAVLALICAILEHRNSVSRLNKLEKDLLKAKRDLLARSQLASEVAHEIKNPLTAILCSADTLNHLVPETFPPDMKKSLYYIKEYGNELLKLVSDFLDLSRGESIEISPMREPTSVFEAVNGVVGLLKANALKKQISMKIAVTDESLVAYADPRHLKQVLFNILHNSIKFTGQNGEIQVIIGSDFPTPMISIVVKDNGIGMSEEELNKLFDPYGKGIGPVTKDTGARLGINLAKNLIEASGGELKIESKKSVGTSVKLLVPWWDGPLKSKRRLPSADVKPLEGQSFLIVDNEIGAREAVARLIEAWGGMVDKVAGAKDAIEALGRREYDAVMVDTPVDPKGAVDLKILRDELVGKSTTLILSCLNPVDQKTFEEIGVDKCVEKPLNGEKLLRSLINSGKYQVTH